MTGYTAYAYKNKLSLKEWLPIVGRAFGAVCDMRDDPISEGIPKEIPVSDYHLRQVGYYENEVYKLEAMNDEERIEFGREMNQDRQTSFESNVKENEDLLQYFKNLLNEIESWSVPNEYLSVKQFMISQVEETIKFKSYDIEIYRPSKKTDMEVFEDYLAEYKHDVEYHKQQYEKDVELNKQKNQWIKGLWEEIEKL